GEEVASTLIKTLRCEWIHGFIADFFNTINPNPTPRSDLTHRLQVRLLQHRNPPKFVETLRATPLVTKTLQQILEKKSQNLCERR
ncbi:hypothetical protein, partial [Mesorhizobium sp. M0323]|uniref:hypothetical protein n=1 Tax=Mesorhizobium sp. M0323 TaxID=2956938 RepID=UPI00333ABBC7